MVYGFNIGLADLTLSRAFSLKKKTIQSI